MLNNILILKGDKTLILERIILTCSLHIKAERTTSAIYHLLLGKKSIQTVQDAHIYQLEKFYGIYRTLTKKAFNQKIVELVNKQHLVKNPSQETTYICTHTGEVWLEKHKNQFNLTYFNGLKYGETANIFFERLILLIQTITNSNKDFYAFIPVIDKEPVENWVKMVYKKTKGSEVKLLGTIYEELYRLLVSYSNKEANIFVDRLTGYKKYGMSIEQLAAGYKCDIHDIQLLLSGVLQSIVHIVQSKNNDFPFLSFILKDLSLASPITKSTSVTHDLLKKTYSIDQIAKIRQLKINTIYDHFVEIALYDKAFPIHQFVSEHTQAEILRAVDQTKTYKLKQLKQQLSVDITYFQIRLVLAIKNAGSK